jgi:glycosyltransferase
MSLKVSLITATYNSVKTFEMCANSVLNQTYSNIEYIIVDGQSDDGTIELLKSMAITHENINWISEADKGIYDALNKGLSRATGDIVGFVHSDDFLSNNNIIASIVESFISTDADGVYGDLHYVAKDNTNKIVRNWVSKQYKLKLLKQGGMPPHPTLYLKKKIYDTYGGFDLNFKIAADYDFILRIFKQTHLKFYYLPKTIVKMRVGGASNRSIKNIIQKSNEDYTAVSKNQIGNWLTILLKNILKIKQFVT